MRKNIRTFFQAFLFTAITFCLASPAMAANRTLALFPFAVYAERPESYVRQGLKTMFLSRLSGGGLDVVTEEDFGSLLTEKEKNGIITRQRAEQVAKKLKADYAVFGSVTTIGAGYSLDLLLLDLTKVPPKLSHVSEAMAEDQFIPKIADVANRFRAIIEGRYPSTRRMVGPARQGPRANATPGIFAKLGRGEESGPGGEGGFFRPTKQYGAFEPTGRISLHMTVVSFDAGDLTGDGSPELAVLSRSELRIYAKNGEAYRLRDTLKASMGEDFLKVSIGDVDGNGRAELYLVSFYGARAQTNVFEWNGKFRKLYRKIGHLLAVKNPRGGTTSLLFENTKLNELFAGRISLMGYDNKGKLKEIQRLPKLKDIRFYTMILYDLNRDGNPEFIGLGDGDALHVWDNKGNVLWSEEESIGGTNNTIQVGDVPTGENKPWVYINSRLVITDIDGDGKKELIAVKNIPLIEYIETMKVYVKSRLIAYRFDGAALTRGWDTKDISYCITDMQAVGGTLFLAAQKGRLSKIGKGKSRIMWFNLR